MDNKNIPLDGIAGLKENWKSDMMSGFIIFLIALPLCIGIALASGAPPMAGLFAGIVGGIVASLLGGSYVTINGPAAGLIAVVVNSINVLGGGDAKLGFELTLAAIVIAGLLQIILGLLKAGNLSVYFSGSVIHGMMAAIGIIIISKQIHVMLGVTPQAKSIMGLLAEIPSSVMKLNPQITLIGVVGIIILIVLPIIKASWVKKIPGPLVVVLVGMGIGLYFDLEDQHTFTFLQQTYEVGPKNLVNLPAHISDGFTTPNFSKVFTLDFFLMMITIMLVASIESLLTTTAIDKLDPYKRSSNMDKELISKGAGNFILGMIGGLPIIAEVVRSSANVNNGAKTRWSNFFHGVFLLIFISLFPAVLHEIPLAALAAILIMVGFKLASPKEFIHTYKKGIDQFIVFIITIILTLVEDLLVGVAGGMVAQVLILIYYGLPIKNILKADFTVQSEGKNHRLTINKALVFSNYIFIKHALYGLPLGEQVTIDLSNVTVIGHAAQEYLADFTLYYEGKGGKVYVEGLDELTPISNHPNATRKLVAKK
ncbi:MAG: SulP family inorganic anion transporter [Leptospiraceae bacterium]|nr:SulP family inorganic anion transporter [Leptospiraceae bacterium]MBK9498330.1 SulP family inorganic anion transporter [Leptospiraceae bacterium]